MDSTGIPVGTRVSMDAADLRGMVRRRWPTLVVSLLVCTAAAAATLVVSPPGHTATTSVLVTPTGIEQVGTASSATVAVLNLETEAQIAQSAAVAEQARSILDVPTEPRELLDALGVSVPANTTVLSIDFTAATPAEARAGARAFAQAYLDARADHAGQVLERRMESLTTQREALRVELAAVDEALERTESGSPERASVSAQQRVLSDQVADLNSEIGVTQATAVSPGRVLTDAQVPTSDIRLALYLAAGLLAGLVVGLLLAYVRERSDPRVRRASDVERLLDIPLLGYVPAGPSGLAPTASPVGQAFGRVRNRVLAALPESAALLVTGASPSRVNADVAVNTAAALARAGVPVTLVLADLQDEEVARMLQVEERPGLAEALLGLAEPTAVTVAVPGIPGLRVLTGGVDRAAAAELVQTRRLHTVLTRLRHEGVLLVHAPATSVSADAQAVASSCDAVVVTAEVARTRRGEVLSAARQLEAVGARLIGAVVAEHPLDLDDARHGTSSGRPAGSTAAPGRPALPVPRETVAVSSGSALAVPTGPLLRWPRRR